MALLVTLSKVIYSPRFDFAAIIENSYMQFKICELQLVPGKTLIIAGYFLQKKESVTSRAETYVSAHIYGKLPTWPHIWKKPTPSEENTHFWGEIKYEIVPNFLYGPVTYTTGIFFLKKLTKIGQSYPQQCRKDFTPTYMGLPPPTR